MQGVTLKLLMLCVGYRACLDDKAYIPLCVHRGAIHTYVSLGACVYVFVLKYICTCMWLHCKTTTVSTSPFLLQL